MRQLKWLIHLYLLRSLQCFLAKKNLFKQTKKWIPVHRTANIWKSLIGRTCPSEIHLRTLTIGLCQQIQEQERFKFRNPARNSKINSKLTKTDKMLMIMALKKKSKMKLWSFQTKSKIMITTCHLMFLKSSEGAPCKSSRLI